MLEFIRGDDVSRYKKGIETKDNIISVSKKLFYLYDFKSVSLNKICKESEVKLGTLTYYFKKKDDLIIYFYNDYMDRIKLFIQENTDFQDSAKLHIYMILMYYFNIYRDYNTVRFHESVLKNTSMYNILYNQKDLIKPFIIHSLLAKNEEMLDLLILADNAVRRELNLQTISSQTKDVYEVKELVTKIYTITAQLFSYDQELLHQHIEEGFEFLLNHVDQYIRLLL